MSIEQKINYQLNKYPAVKIVVKRIYQLLMYWLSPKIKSEGNIVRISPEGKGEYFFGYYDKSPWDSTGRYVLCMHSDDTWSEADATRSAEIVLIDTHNDNAVRTIATTETWNVQQGCMAQWLGPDFKSRILYNDMTDGAYCSKILNPEDGSETILQMPVYSVSADGKTALSLDFSRLHNLRPGYGYAMLEERTKDTSLPDATAVWKINLETDEVVNLLTYKDFASFNPRPEMLLPETVHKVNHLMLSPDGKRFMVLYRWFCGQRKYTRLITCNTDGSDMFLLSDDDMVSHCYWKNNREIVAFENKHGEGTGYYLMRDKTSEYRRLWKDISNDGHPSCSPSDENVFVFDTYPDKTRVQELKIGNVNYDKPDVVARVFSPFRYDNDTRCDLHPRWDRDGKRICFDATFEGYRGVYVVNM